jgi:carboxyl-terminal processing protease
VPFRNLTIIAVAAVISLACFYKSSKNRYASTIIEAMELIEANALEEVDTYSLFEGAMDGMVSKIDEHSDFIPRGEFARTRESLDQQFGGVGIQVDMDNEAKRVKVVVPMPNTPAFEAGLKPGDRILTIDGKDTKEVSLNKVVGWMRGKDGEVVRLTVSRKGVDEPLDFDIARAIIQTESVKGDTRRADGRWEFYLKSHPRIGYIRMTTFGDRTPGELKKALDYNGHDIDALILDLRDNPGGLLKAAVEICDMFIDRSFYDGRIVTTRDRHKRVRDEHIAEDETSFPKSLPMVVLTSGMSASASEIVAACLADHQRAVIIGERSWGKGTVQNIITMEGGQSALKLTTASYWRPNGENIHRGRDKDGKRESEKKTWGVRPKEGLEVKLDNEQRTRMYKIRQRRDFENLLGPDNEPMVIEEGADDKSDPSNLENTPADPQLEKAIEYLLDRIGKNSSDAARAA